MNKINLQPPIQKKTEMIFPETERVIYDKNPLAGVICQFRFSPIAKIGEEPSTPFHERIRNPFTEYRMRDPFAEAVAKLETEIPEVPPNIQEAMKTLIQWPASRRASIEHEFTSEDGIWQISLTRNLLSLTCQDYKRWEEFKDHLDIALHALLDVYAPDKFSRIGLRYKDVVDRSYLGIDKVPWSELLQPYIAGELSSGVSESSIEKKLSETLINLDTYDAKVSIHHGLAEAEAPSEIGYIIDSEFYTEQPTETMNADNILREFNRSAGNFFRWCITKKLHEAMGPRPIGR